MTVMYHFEGGCKVYSCKVIQGKDANQSSQQLYISIDLEQKMDSRCT